MSLRYVVRFGSDYAVNGSATGTLVRAPYNGGEEPSNFYPQAVGPLILGRVPGNDAFSMLSSLGWASGDDEVLRGRWRRGNSAGPTGLRIDLPDGSGIYRVGAGSAAATFVRSRWRMNDGVGGASRVDVSFSGVTVFGADEPANLDQWVVLTGTNSVANAGAIDADAFDPPQAGVEIEVASGVMEFINGGNGTAFSSDISFLWFEKVGGDPPPPPPGLSPLIVRRRRTVIL